MLSNEEIGRIRNGDFTETNTILYEIKGNKLNLGEKTIEFSYPVIENVRECKNRLIVLNTYPLNMLKDNPHYDVIAIDTNGTIIWHMENPKESELMPKHYSSIIDPIVGISILEHFIVAHSYGGGNCILNFDTGKIIGYYACKG